MSHDEIREAVEVGNKLKQVFESFFWKGEKDHPEKIELLHGLEYLLALAQSHLDAKEPKGARDILHQFGITYNVSSREERNKSIDQALKDLSLVYGQLQPLDEKGVEKFLDGYRSHCEIMFGKKGLFACSGCKEDFARNIHSHFCQPRKMSVEELCKTARDWYYTNITDEEFHKEIYGEAV